MDKGLRASRAAESGGVKTRPRAAWRPIKAASKDGSRVILWMCWGSSALTMGWADAFAVRDCWWQDGKWVHVYRGGPAELDGNYIAAWAPSDAALTGGPDGEDLDWWRA